MKIIGISGRKQAGKNTVANYINGHILKQRNMIEDFYLNDKGELTIKTSDSTGNIGYGIFDPTRKDNVFIEYAEKELWPYIKIHHFADPLKELAINLFGLNYQQVYGTDDDKNTSTHLLWENIPECPLGKTGHMTARDFLQHFGTNIVRKIYNNAWIDATINKIINEDSELSIIPDVRFANEVKAIKDNNGIVIRLTRDLYHSSHDSEKALDEDNFDWDNFDLVIDNKNINIEQLCELLKYNSRIWSI